MKTKQINSTSAPILTYDEYQEKISNLKTPEDIAAFVQALVGPALNGMKVSLKEEDTDGEGEPELILEKEPLKIVKRIPVPQPNTQSPWFDVVTNDTDAMVIDLYAKGLTTRDIVNFLKRNHGIEMSQPNISSITDKVFPLVKEWQSRPLPSVYAMVYLDGMHFKVRDAGKISSKVAYIAMGVDIYGMKEILGIWISETEGAKFWLHVLNELKNRGIDDILITCVDGLKGFPDAIKAIFPQTEVQVCVVHQIRRTVMFISTKDLDNFCKDLKTVYTAPTEDAGLTALKEVTAQWPKYAAYLKSWEKNWKDLTPFFNYPEPIKRMMYTTNAIENLNRQFRKVTKTTQIFPHDDALLKLLWLAQTDISGTWIMATRNWGEIMGQLSILFPDRMQF
jgi:transposase-like protein